MELDIVELIEKNPLTRLSGDYQGKLLTKIKNKFSDIEMQFFLASFYCTLNYDQFKDFVIDLDDLWKWLDFNKKEKAKELLERNFTKDIDYVILLPHKGEKKDGRGGSNIIKYFLNIKTFKSFCLKAGTTRAEQLHEYYLKLEDIVHEITTEENEELRKKLEKNQLMLELSEKEKEKIIIDSKKEKEVLREKTLLEQFPKNRQCVYYGLIDNKSVSGEKLIKFGNSNDLVTRVDAHKKVYSNFCLVNVFKVSNQIQIENAIKKNSILKKLRRNIIIDGNNYTELLAIDKLTFEEIDQNIKEIIRDQEYNIENYNKLLEKNNELENNLTRVINENEKLIEQVKSLEGKLEELSPKQTINEKYKVQYQGIAAASHKGYYLYAFECKENRFKFGLCRLADLENRKNLYKETDPNGDMKHLVKISFPVFEKIMGFLLKERLTRLRNDMVDGSLEEVKKILNITEKLEDILTDEKLSLDDIHNILHNNLVVKNIEEQNPEVPVVRKAQRPIDQINVESGKVIANYKSIEEAGRIIGCTGSAIGIALRNKTLCKGYLFRYAGISDDDQMKDQPVIKICCSNGEKIYFPNMAAAGRDAGISAPALRQRILTKVHINDHHWIFNKEATHYNQKPL